MTLIECLKLALNEAKKAEKIGEVPVGAVVIRNGKVIAKGKNERERKQNPCSHAEIEAILKAARKLSSWRLDDCELYVTLEPCPMCLAACQASRIRKVIYGAIDPKGGAISLGYLLHQDKRINHRFQVEHYPHPESGSILSHFFKKIRNQKSGKPVGN